MRGWAPFGSPASHKIDRIENKKVANELLSCVPLSLQNNVVVRAPFDANYQISFGIKDGGGWESCRAVQEALISGIESNMIDVRGSLVKVSIVKSESYLLCPKSCKILSTDTNEDLGETPKCCNAWVWHRKKFSRCGVSLSGWEDFKS